MWSKPIVVWMIHGVVAGGGFVFVMSDDVQLRIAGFVAIMLFRVISTRLISRASADAKLLAACRMAAARRGL
jgi:hypothetical protein